MQERKQMKQRNKKIKDIKEKEMKLRKRNIN
jgi:hypothetical protein